MIKRKLVLSITTIFLLASCSQVKPPAPTLVPPPTSTTIPALLPTSTPEQFSPDPLSILFEQDFEAETASSDFPMRGNWEIKQDGNGNNFYCNSISSDWSSLRFGWPSWQNYAVEIQVKFVKKNPDQGVELYSRIDTGYEGYRASLGDGWASLGFYPPPQTLADSSLPIEANTWYVLRLETYGSQLRYFIDDQQVIDVVYSQRSEGMAGFGVAPNTEACLDNIRVWALSETGAIGQAPLTIHPELEVVTDKAVTGDGGNQWGGHQTRIVRTSAGVFTAYTVEGGGHFAREWQLAWRQEDGTWKIVAMGDAGREPVNLLASPDGTLHIIGWPNQTASMWSGKPDGGHLNMMKQNIPGLAHSDWPYGSAGIDAEGNLCVLSSVGGETRGGKFKWACFLQSQGKWVSQTSTLDYRYCYTYVFPGPGGQLSLVSTRDVRWEALGYTQPRDVFEYVFNAVGSWHSGNIEADPLQQVLFMEEVPTEAFPYVYIDGQEDAYQDTAGNMHILYNVQGESTQGVNVNRHVILSPKGEILTDVVLPKQLGEFARIFQDNAGSFYILGSSGVLYPAGNDGVTLATPIQIDLNGYTVEYTGFAVSVQRTGTPLSNVIDVVFPTGDGMKWVYFQLPLLK